jgi:hypothetical protein
LEPEGIPLEPLSVSGPATSNDEASSSESGVEDERSEEVKDVTCWGKTKRFFNFMIETEEYRDPQTHGWRIKFRRLCLTLGVFFFSYTTIHSTIKTQSYSSKHEIQKILVNKHFTDTQLVHNLLF